MKGREGWCFIRLKYKEGGKEGRERREFEKCVSLGSQE